MSCSISSKFRNLVLKMLQHLKRYSLGQSTMFPLFSVCRCFSSSSVCDVKQTPQHKTQLHANSRHTRKQRDTATNNQLKARHEEHDRHLNTSRLTFLLHWALPSDITIKGRLWLAETQVRLQWVLVVNWVTSQQMNRRWFYKATSCGSSFPPQHDKNKRGTSSS